MGDVASVPFAETPVRVEGVESQDGDDDHDALEHDEQGLVLDQFPLPALRQLDDAVDAADEDAQRGHGQGGQEAAEPERAAQLGVVGVEGAGPVRAGVAHGADGEVGANEHEDAQGEDLKGQPGHHDLVAVGRRRVVVRGHAGHAAADGLEHERDDVARDEEARVRERFDPRVGRPERDHDAGQRQVDAGGEEGRRDGQTDDLHQEPILPLHNVSQLFRLPSIRGAERRPERRPTYLVSRIVVGHEPSGVAEHFQNAS